MRYGSIRFTLFGFRFVFTASVWDNRPRPPAPPSPKVKKPRKKSAPKTVENFRGRFFYCDRCPADLVHQAFKYQMAGRCKKCCEETGYFEPSCMVVLVESRKESVV